MGQAVQMGRASADLVVLGTGELVRSLMRHGLIEEFVLLIHPLVLGSGRRLFPDGVPPTTLRLVDSTPTTTGVIIATYHLRLDQAPSGRPSRHGRLLPS